LGVVDQQQDRPLPGQVGQQAERAELDQEPAGAAVGEPEGPPHRVRLRPGQPAQAVEDRPQ
jgi:hypothetical protein